MSEPSAVRRERDGEPARRRGTWPADGPAEWMDADAPDGERTAAARPARPVEPGHPPAWSEPSIGPEPDARGGDDGGTERGEAARRPRRRSRGSEIWREWVRPFLFVLIAVVTLRSAVADWNDVPTGSMRPTILEGERIFVNKVAYDLKVPFTLFRLAEWADPQRGDVVVLFSPADGKRLVKRVVGLPGDVLSMRNNRLMVNGEEVAYEPMDDSDLESLAFVPGMEGSPFWEELEGESHPVLWAPYSISGRAFRPLVVPDGSYFVMGDNRNRSRDSRFFGFVSREAIVGQATAIVISVDPEDSYTPRWGRFFRSLE